MIKKRKGTDPMFSKTFKEGFASGFGAPFSFFAKTRIERPRQYSVNVYKAWTDAGMFLSRATEKQGSLIESETRKTRTKKRGHKSAA